MDTLAFDGIGDQGHVFGQRFGSDASAEGPDPTVVMKDGLAVGLLFPDSYPGELKGRQVLPVSKKFEPNLILLRIDHMEVINEHEAG